MSAIAPVLDLDLFGQSPDQRSIEILREWEPEGGYYSADSFGKDSCVCRDLLLRAGVKFDAHHNLTTIDPPELIQFGRKHHPETIIERPQKSFWQYIREGKGLPMRNARWCCEELKEHGGEGRRVIVGVRAAESSKRAAQTMVQPCSKAGMNGKVLVKPIFFWTDEQVWEYIRRRELPYCSLYDEGWKRLGCVLCPFEANVARAQERWPRMFEGLLRAVTVAYPTMESFHKFGSPEGVLEWWLDRTRSYPGGDDQQMVLDQFGGDDQ